MEKAKILSDLQTVFDQVFLDDVRLTEDLSAKNVPEWDSLTHISLIVAVEKKFGVRFRTGEVEAAQNVGQFIDLIYKHCSEK